MVKNQTVISLSPICLVEKEYFKSENIRKRNLTLKNVNQIITVFKILQGSHNFVFSLTKVKLCHALQESIILLMKQRKDAEKKCESHLAEVVSTVSLSGVVT